MPPNTNGQDYSFILKGAQPNQKPRLNLRSKGIFYLAGVLLIGLIVVLILAGRAKPQTEVIAVAARASEIARVSDLAAQTTTNADTKSLATTVSASMNSEKSQLVSYLATSKIKVSTATLDSDKNSSIDSQLQTAAQNNSLDQAYFSYLKTNLGTYLAQITTASKAAGPQGKAVLNNAATSTQALLSAPALKP